MAEVVAWLERHLADPGALALALAPDAEADAAEWIRARLAAHEGPPCAPAPPDAETLAYYRRLFPDDDGDGRPVMSVADFGLGDDDWAVIAEVAAGA